MDKVNIFGFGVDKVSMAQAMDCFEDLINKDGLSIVVTANPEILNEASKNKELAEIINAADLVTPDGMSLVLLSKVKGDPFTERVTGIDFAFAALKRISELGKSVYLLGGKPGVAEQAGERLKEMIPGLVVAGTNDGYFKEAQEAEIVEKVNASGADFLLVAMGAPRQEFFLSRHKNELKAKVGVGVGGSLDVWSGNTKRAPEFYQKHNIEWLYRLKTEPQRFGRMAKIPVFMLKVIFDR
ncbi:MAG: WecB/TagA/CpsF family glycosyltransferase [Clostridia bacterium]|nr:WecB/TagA/CpsF family glycosyltransferase [Clostridia bacterium]